MDLLSGWGYPQALFSGKINLGLILLKII